MRTKINQVPHEIKCINAKRRQDLPLAAANALEQTKQAGRRVKKNSPAQSGRDAWEILSNVSLLAYIFDRLQ